MLMQTRLTSMAVLLASLVSQVISQQCRSDQYYDSARTACITCPSGCDRCSSYSACTSCLPGYFLYGICQPCVDGCASCSDKTTCKVCGPSYFLTTANLCNRCATGCSRCLSDSVSSCSECELGWYYETTRCYQCAANCKRCTSAQSCEACMADYELKDRNCVKQLAQPILPNNLQNESLSSTLMWISIAVGGSIIVFLCVWGFKS